MTQQLLRLHCAIEQATRGPTTADQRKELRRAFIAVLTDLKGVELADVGPLDRLQAALADCYASNVPARAIAEQLYGSSSLATLMGSER